MKKILNFVRGKMRVDSPFVHDTVRQKKFISQFSTPKNDFERSFFQYKCQRFLNSGWKIPVFNFLSFISVPLMLLYLFLKAKSKESGNEFDAIFINGGIDKILPSQLKDEYSNIKVIEFGTGKFLVRKDLRIIMQLILRYPLNSYFVFKCIFKISLYRSINNYYSPKAIITTSEYSFTSSVLTNFCERNDICHINIMHGEKLFYIRDSFFRFHRFYVWDNHYKKLFISLKAYSSQFFISPAMFFKFQSKLDGIHKNDFTYYLGAESENELRQINDTLLLLKEKGNKIAIRPHPRYSDWTMICLIFKLYHIEDFNKISIEQSILSTNHIIGLYSTVLYQGYLNGKIIIIDDITSKEKYNSLLQLDFIMLSKRHQLLSSLV